MFGLMMGDGLDDLMGGHMRQMQNMMNSILGNPFGSDMYAGGGNSGNMQMMPFETDNRMMSPFGLPNMGQLMRSMSMSNNPNCHSFSSSSVMTMTTGPDGKPQVYQASQSTRAGPGGIRETKKSVSDTRTGVKKLSIGHHIGERAHIKEREQNLYSGEQEENEEYINLDEEQADEFNNEWQRKTQHFQPRSRHGIDYRHNPGNQEYLALPPAPRSKYIPKRIKSGSCSSSYLRALPEPRYRALPSLSYSAEPEHSLKQESQQKKKDHRSKPYNKRKEKRTQE